MVKADGSVLVHSDGGSYKPLNWMSPPCAMAEVPPEEHEAADGASARTPASTLATLIRMATWASPSSTSANAA